MGRLNSKVAIVAGGGGGIDGARDAEDRPRTERQPDASVESPALEDDVGVSEVVELDDAGLDNDR